MTLLIFLALLFALALAALLWGHDSRDGRDWKPSPENHAGAAARREPAQA